MPVLESIPRSVQRLLYVTVALSLSCSKDPSRSTETSRPEPSSAEPSSAEPSTQTEQVPIEDARRVQARDLTDAFQKQLKAELMQALQKGGALTALEVCHERAPQIAEEVRKESGRTNWALRRTALRVRNPDNSPNEWQRRGLLDLEKKLSSASTKSAETKSAETKSAAKDTAPKKTPVEWVEQSQDGVLHYMRAIEMGPLCITCHGEPAALSSEVRDKLAQLYPNDRATGFSLGDLRGAFVVTAPSDSPE